MNCGWRVMTLYRRQEPRQSPRKRNAKRQNGCPRRPCKDEKRKDSRSKGQKKRYIHLNAEFQRIARRDKKAFLTDQCKEIEENNRIVKTGDIFKKIRDIKGIFHAKMDTEMDRNNMYLTEKKILRRSGKNTQKNYAKDILMSQITTKVITPLGRDILECEVKWTLESITTNKASRSDEIPAELFQILKVDVMKVLDLICQEIWKVQQWPQDWKRSVLIPIPRKAMSKNAQTTT